VGAASNHGNALKEKIAGNCKIPQKQQIIEFGLATISISISLDAAPTHGLVHKEPIYWKYQIQPCPN